MAEYNDPKEALQTHDENGFRVSDHDPKLRFPTDATLKALTLKLNEHAESHVRKACPVGSECDLCFFTKACLESKEIDRYVKRLGSGMLGPLATALIDYSHFFVVMSFMLLLGLEVNKGVKTADEVTAEVEALNNLLRITGTKSEMEHES